jgi:murein DD-endopeptidase MepM/ murein hydrolase activator NlpD
MLSTSVNAGPSYEVFGETFGSGWSSQPWGATVTTATPPITFRGTKAAKVVYTTAMGVFKPVASAGFKTTGYKHLIFAVYNYSNADDLWLVAQTTGGTLGTYLRVADYTDIGGAYQGRWSWVRIPISHLGLGSTPTLSFFSVASGKANATAYFDDVGFAASSVLYEGINKTNTSNGPGIQRWYWNGTISTPYLTDGSYYIKVTPTNSWAGVQFQQRVGDLVTTDYGSLAIRFRQEESLAYQRLHVTLTDRNGSAMGATVVLDQQYLPSTITFEAGSWYHVSIPMSHFGISSPWLGGVVIESNSAYRFWIDDVRFVQKLSWMIPGVSRNVGGYRFGDHWLNGYCSTYRKLHTGNDYSDGTGGTGGHEVRTASRGFVKQKREQFDDTGSSWGYAVVIQHENGLTTSSLHLNPPNVNVGDEVQRGTYLGTTKYLPSGPHLHFGVRLKDYDITFSQAGALPEMSCAIGSTTYPAFSDGFINSEHMDW